MTADALRLLAALMAAVCLSAMAPEAVAQPKETAPAVDEVVFCHDVARRIVQRMLVGDCRGVVVSAEAAEKIRADAIERRRRMLASPKKPVVSGLKLRSIGTGFFVAPDGRLLTNNHVVEGCGALSVETPDGHKTEAELLATRPEDDLALVRARMKAPAVATFLVDERLAPGTPITLIGYPDQGLAPRKPLLTHGTLGASNRLAGGRPRFEIQADVRHGNSGGPVVDRRALVIGVVYAKINSVAVFERTGRKVRFVGAVIDNHAVFEFLDRHGVDYRKASDGAAFTPDGIDAPLRPIVVRVGCWK